jgi:hypothetical protein
MIKTTLTCISALAMVALGSAIADAQSAKTPSGKTDYCVQAGSNAASDPASSKANSVRCDASGAKTAEQANSAADDNGAEPGSDAASENGAED